MDFLFSCGWCGEENVLYGERTGFWNNRFSLPDTFDCWNCGGSSTVSAPPWTPAD